MFLFFRNSTFIWNRNSSLFPLHTPLRTPFWFIIKKEDTSNKSSLFFCTHSRKLTQSNFNPPDRHWITGRSILREAFLPLRRNFVVYLRLLPLCHIRPYNPHDVINSCWFVLLWSFDRGDMVCLTVKKINKYNDSADCRLGCESIDKHSHRVARPTISPSSTKRANIRL